MNKNAEQLNIEKKTNIEKLHPIDSQLEKQEKNPELSVELSPRDIEAKTEQLRAESLENAVSIENNNKENENQNKKEQTQKRVTLGKKQLDKSFNQTMKQVQDQLPINSRGFSKIIHNKTVEKTSDVVGKTIARPNSMLAGAIFAFILTLIIYTIAKTIGYKLSGFETIAAFIIGWLIGLIYDYLRILITGKKE